MKKNKKGGDELKKVKETTNQKKSAVSKKDSDLQSKNLDGFLQDWNDNEENDSEAAEDEAENDGLDPGHKLPDNLEVASNDSD